MAGRTARVYQRRKEDTDSLWLITFADLMVQLMAFFALLYSFGAQDQVKMQQVLESLRKALGVQVEPANGILPGTGALDPTKASDLEKALTEAMSQEGPDKGVRMRIVTFRGSLSFENGSATIAPGSAFLLDRIAKLTGDYPGFTLICEGHAAPGERDRLNGGDALSLSSARAQNAMRELLKRGVPGAIIALEAHGDTKAEGDTSSAEGRALNQEVKFRFQRVAER